MDRLKKARRPLRAQVTRLINEMTTTLSQDDVDEKALRVNLVLLQKAASDLEELDGKVKEQMLDDDADDAAFDEEMQTVEQYCKSFISARSKAEEILSVKNSAPSSVCETSGGDKGKRKFKLPTVQLKTFGGNLKEWLGWWSQFDKIHRDEDLHDSDKFQYLMQAMEPDTEAKDLVESYPQTEENYGKAVEALRERFGRHDLLLQVYVRELLTLVISNVTSKEKPPLAQLYVRLESHLRSLGALKLDKADPATWLFPLVESSLSEETLRAWQRSSYSKLDGSLYDPPKSRLDYLMEFMKVEVRTEQQISLAQSGFQSGVTPQKKIKGTKAALAKYSESIPTAAGLISGQADHCAFCGKGHASERCYSAKDMTLVDKKKAVKKSRLCFRCLRPGHQVKSCKRQVKCFTCKEEHLQIMCPRTTEKGGQIENNVNVTSENESGAPQNGAARVFQTSTSQCSPNILLNTLTVEMLGKDGSVGAVRLVGDSGSQRSYAKTDLIHEMKCDRVGQEWLQQVLFGGKLTPPQLYGTYHVMMRGYNGMCAAYQLLEKDQLCGRIQKVPYGSWIDELSQYGIHLSDLGEGYEEIDVLIGNDLWGSLLTGKIVKLTCGLVATETIFGWTLGGPLPEYVQSYATAVCSMICSSEDITQLWSLEAIGIRDPIETKSATEENEEALRHFSRMKTRDETGAFVVALPWKCDKGGLPSNFEVAERRLRAATLKLKREDKFAEYEKVFKSWEDEDFIVKVNVDQFVGHYLPHRPIFKNSVTTPVRPVFDASCKTGKKVSLNDCLHTGPNLIELIPELLLRFRERSIGVTADIRKAFQMVKVMEEDQPFQKFLWWEDESCTRIIAYQHKRVVFGLTCSPFLLGAVIDDLLKNDIGGDIEVASLLRRSFYVDNCVTSLDSSEDYEDFRLKATAIMAGAGMELRQWEASIVDRSDVDPNRGCGLSLGEGSASVTKNVAAVLGVLWNKEEDTISCEIKDFVLCGKVTKRLILSVLAQLFDPLGIICPAVLLPKVLIQESWTKKFGWDEPVPEEVETKFITWGKGLHLLSGIQVPRHFQLKDAVQREVHIFCDASQASYAAVAFVRSETDENMEIRFLMAKSRLAPMKRATIPRLELLSCLIGARIAKSVQEALGYKNVKFHFWSDSTTALTWIKRRGNWGVFVANRVNEILSITSAEQWKHVPGTINPADLPSRGCSSRRLVKSAWWEGPAWLKRPREEWPRSQPTVNEDDVAVEVRKTAMFVSLPIPVPPRFPTYRKNVAVWGWVLRFINGCKKKKSPAAYLNVYELRRAEKIVLRQIQEDCFPATCEEVGGIQVYRDQDRILRVKSRLSNRMDKEDFIYPVLLPKRHPLVDLLIEDVHRYHGHGGVQFMQSKLREKYWILQSRRAVRKVLRNCVKCRRHSSKRLEVEPSSLPEKRVETSEPFETTGVDLAGPLFLRDGQKAWVVLYTCAVYRCLYLDVVTSLSTEAFMGSLERFVSTHGRPNTVYSDNGTNFVGAVNLFKQADWASVERESGCRQINWIFNPPTAAWWGGWWEILVKLVKELLRRMLGKSKLSYDELRTCLSGVATTINDRPLTVVSEDNMDLVPLTPGMFIRSREFGHMPEGGSIDAMKSSYRRMKTFQRQLQNRFRKEYLSGLVTRGGKKRISSIAEGDVVLVGADNRKRFEWPLGVILEVFPGKDGKVRVAKVKTMNGVLTRPLQRLYPLEISSPKREGIVKKASAPPCEVASESDVHVDETFRTKSGRISKKPTRYSYWSHLLK